MEEWVWSTKIIIQPLFLADKEIGFSKKQGKVFILIYIKA
jgi:hypothetical protein